MYIGTSDAKLLRTGSEDGAGSYESSNFVEFGIKYLRGVSNQLYLETGLNYSSSDVKITPVFVGENSPLSSYKELKLVSVPINAHYEFWKYLFVNGGPLLDFEITDNTNWIDSQSGIGYILGFGGKYRFNKLSLFVNPNFKRHAVVPFKRENNHQKLTEVGVQFGLGFEF
ncbi:hypothetical protein [Echinicola sp. 20G]|uniref:hypothetical protein n=1 Tax=Echinicola sp. 20G TaxID=2781961 RepID=UPI00190FEE12|nr:hypothetical protein [Echinicola sp. 20G]